MKTSVDGGSCATMTSAATTATTATTSDCPAGHSTSSSPPAHSTLLGDSEIDILLRKAGLSVTDRGSVDAADSEQRAIADTECRIGQCRLPNCVQGLATVRTFTAMCCTLAALTGALTAGYVNSVITTIEKRFEIGSSYSGLIAASVEIGGVMSAIFVSYLGSQRHIPNWIGCGAVITSFGTLVFTVPHMMAPAYTVTGGLNSSRTSDNICKERQVDDFYSSSGVTEKCLSRESGQLNHVLILVIAQLMIGIGGSPLYTLGTTFIDNHIAKRKAPSYIAFIYACAVFGPLLGFALGALMLQYYVDWLSFDTVLLRLNTSNPRWVGAWWAGFIFIGGLFFLVSLPFFGFPRLLIRDLRELVREDPSRLDALIQEHSGLQCRRLSSGVSGSSAHTQQPYGKTLRDLPRAVWHLVTNPIYIVTCLGICCEVSIVSGFVVFLPKYLETQFGATKSAANLLTGSSSIPGAVLGILVGGYCLRRFQLTGKGAIQLTLCFNVVALLGFGLFFVFGCDNVKIAGVTVPYQNSSVAMTTSTSPRDYHDIIMNINLTSQCNADCTCNSNTLEPVCGSNHVTYFSPCHAGCARLISPSQSSLYNAFHLDHVQNYSSCSCVVESWKRLATGSSKGLGSLDVLASSGVCNERCATLVPFMIMLFVMTFVISATQMPLLMITIRSVDEEEKAFALGVQFVMLRLFAYIPSPIMYGNIIDSACLFWSEQCGYNGNCLIYDLVYFRYKYVGFSFTLKVLAASFYIFIWMLLRRQSSDDMHLASTCLKTPDCGVVISTVSQPTLSVDQTQTSVTPTADAVQLQSKTNVTDASSSSLPVNNESAM